MGQLAGKVAIVTGAAQGQGAAEACLFAAEGARVVVTDVLAGAGRSVARGIGPSALFLEHDVSIEEDWARVVRTTLEAFGRIDALVNNAAILEMRSLEQTTEADYLRTISINQVGPFLGMRSVLGPMREVGGGSIVNVSSTDGIIAKNGVGAYASTKFALRGMTKVAALEWGKYGIRVNTLHPGAVDTAMWGDATNEAKAESTALEALPRIGEPEEIAALALFLVSDASSFCTGAEFIADGGHCAGSRHPAAPGF